MKKRTQFKYRQAIFQLTCHKISFNTDDVHINKQS